jgi:simple sugar transport system ATP-binding protein
VFQDFAPSPLAVAENIALFLPDLPWALDRSAVARRIRSMSARYGFEVDPSAEVWRWSVGERQKQPFAEKVAVNDDQCTVASGLERGQVGGDVRELGPGWRSTSGKATTARGRTAGGRRCARPW